MNRTVTSLSVIYPVEEVETLIELVDPDFNPTFFHDLETGVCRVSFFIEEEEKVEDAKSAIESIMLLLGRNLQLERAQVRREDWAESWKRFFHVEHVSPRLVIRPSWEAYSPTADEKVLIIDPGINFGTGKHPTTQACLKFLDELASENTEKTVLDMGCGTGILAIGAKLLGFEKVSAFDIDPDCITGTRENAEINGVEIPVCEGSIADAWPECDIAVANILAPVLIEFAEPVCKSVVPGGKLILSGILDTQYAEVKAAYEKLGMRELKNLQLGEWKSGIFEKPGTPVLSA